MSKASVRFGAVLKCDIVTVVDTKMDVLFNDQCAQQFITYSVSSFARQQAADVGWSRVAVRLVRWPGMPPMEDKKKVDICPVHRELVMTAEEYKAKRDAARAQAKLEKAAKRKPRAPRKPKTAEAVESTG